MTRTYLYILFLILSCAFASCIEDGFTTSPSDQPAFSVDTLDIGYVYTDELTRTSRFTVYNRHNKGLNLSKVAISGENANLFRINVDGMSGREFNDIEIRAKDSIFVFIEAQLPENGMHEAQRIDASVDFTVNGRTSSVVISALGQDVVRLIGESIDTDMRFVAGKPYLVSDSLVVAAGATLTLDPGVKMLFRDKSRLTVRGTLLSLGTPEKPILLTGDRTGDVIPDVSFDIMSRQWDCVDFMESSVGNRLEYTEISNTCYGVSVFGDGSDLDSKKLTLINCKLRNSGECVLLAFNASIEGIGCEFAEAGYGLVYLLGGNHRFDQCTAANNYLFSAVEGAAWMMIDPKATQEYADIDPTKALITNTITYGLGKDVEPGDFTGQEVYFKRCLFKSEGTDDANFVDCIWGQDPLFYTVRNEYHFDYRLKPESPAIGAAYPALSETPLTLDFYGEKRKGDLGAYAYKEPAEE